MDANADGQAYRERLDRIAEIFTDMATRAEAISRTRCPYRDRLDQCTALFRCRNQIRPPDDTEDRLTCGHDGAFDYRSAWETHPRARDRVQQKIAAIRREAETRRGGNGEAPGR